jgi:mannosyltransferase OCH1-like enzyme
MDFIPNFLKRITFYPENYEFAKNNISFKNSIPRIIHLIWVGETKAPVYFDIHVKKWQELMPNWEIRVWKNKDITIQHFPEKIINILQNVEKGAQKADIMRYFIMEKYGGVYLDSDITPHKSLEPLMEIDTKVILCHDLPLTWQYISIGFFAAEPYHPLFKLASELCYSATINTEDLHMQTGPRLLGESIFRLDENKIEIKTNEITLLPIKFFYRNENYEGRFGHHFYAKMW